MADRKTKRLSEAQYRKRQVQNSRPGEKKKLFKWSVEKYLKYSVSYQDITEVPSTSKNLEIKESSKNVQPSTSASSILTIEETDISTFEPHDEALKQYPSSNYNDPAEWPEIIFSELGVILVKKGAVQVKKYNFPKTNLGKFSVAYYVV